MANQLGWSWADQFGGGMEDDDNDEEASSNKAFWAERDGHIFLIDCSQLMFEKQGESSNMELCIQCCQNVMKEKIISSERDLIGIVFFATEKSKNNSDFKNIFVFQDLGQPGADEVLALDTLLKDVNSSTFGQKYGHSADFSLSDVLWTCSNTFSKCSKKLGSKRIMLFTCNDDPHSGNQQLKNQAKTKAADLQEMGIELQLLHMHRQGALFSVDKFYKDLLFYNDSEDVQDAAEQVEQLQKRVFAKINKKRTIGKVPLSLGAGLDMAVGVYTLMRSASKPPHVKLYKKTNEEVKTVTRYYTDTGDILMPHDMKKSQDWAGRSISFEVDELNQMKKFDAPGLSLMGFKPQSCLKRHYHVKPCQFIYPEETIIKGSTSLFTALLRKCLEREVVAICRYIARKNTPPRFVALLPQEEEIAEDKSQIAPPGFHVVFLPFADDFRKINFAPTAKASTEQIDKAKEVVKRLKFKYTPEMFDNPNLQTYYRNLEALALDRDAPEEFTDLTMPDEELFETRAGKEIQNFKTSVYPVGYEPAKKRKLNENMEIICLHCDNRFPRKKQAPSAGGSSKAVKAEAMECIDLKAEAEGGRLSKLTVDALTKAMKALGIKGKGRKKTELIEAINFHFGIS